MTYRIYCDEWGQEQLFFTDNDEEHFHVLKDGDNLEKIHQ